MTDDTSRNSLFPTIMSAVLAVIGLALLVGGVVLVARGGSLYYAIAGVALLVDAWLLWRRRAAALWLYAAIVLATMAWAVWEVGLDFWQLAPRGDILVPIAVLLALPWVARPLSAERKWPGPAWPLLGAIAISVVVAVVALSHDEHRLDGRIATTPGGPVQVDPLLAAGDWPAYGGSLKGQRWSPLAQITPANADKLEQVWRFDTGDVKRPNDPDEFTYEVTPIKVGNLLYVCTPHNLVIALDAETGKQVWRYDPHIADSKDMQHLTCRGVSYHADDGVAPGAASAPCAQRIIEGTNDARLIELDALTGRPCGGFGVNGQVEVWPGQPPQKRGWWQITSPPVVTRDLIIFGGAVFDNRSTFMPSGVIRAYDVHTGKPVWAFDPGKPADTSPRGVTGTFVPSSPNSWTMASADEGLGLVYVPMGMAAVDQWGG
ncbi:MAG: outer membrane protein assembly factor BamB family protein, partial [Tsuneonella sp.]